MAKHIDVRERHTVTEGARQAKVSQGSASENTGPDGEERDVGKTAGETTSRDEWASSDRVKSPIWEIGIGAVGAVATSLVRNLDKLIQAGSITAKQSQ